ncbi:hypothetical protein J3458_000832 [Metarhizium acridum]|uniref:uncharacterized protein n=1 Tax=Metarhizium acridum TaxID=92637 RepID=UPI001C6B8C22|nr:hypothetical protein J3458_000832 [Metarhizium acridum]
MAFTKKDMGLDKVAVDVDVGHRRKCSRPVAPSRRKLASRTISLSCLVKMTRLNSSSIMVNKVIYIIETSRLSDSSRRALARQARLGTTHTPFPPFRPAPSSGGAPDTLLFENSP